LINMSSSLATCFYRINTRPFIHGKKNPLADPELRRALAYSIDREKIVNHILRKGGEVAHSLVPPMMGLKASKYFTNQQQEFLHRGNFFQSINQPLIISYVNSERNGLIAQAVQSQWKEQFGIEVLLEAVEVSTYLQRLSQGDFQIAAGTWFGNYNDPIDFLEVFKYKNGGGNNTGWEDLEYIDLLHLSRFVDNDERAKILENAEMILLEHMPIIPICHLTFNYMKQKRLMHVFLAPTGQLDLRSAYIQPSK